MKITLTIDETQAAQLTGSDEPTADAVAKAITSRLALLKQIPAARDRLCVVLPEARRELERLLDLGTLEHGDQLVNRLRPFMQLVVGPVTLDLTAAEWDRLNGQAVFMGQPPHDYLRQVLREVLNETALRY